MSVVLSVLAIVLSLLLVVGFHEAGHALVARLFAVRIKRISIGFGKPLLRWQRPGSDCEWVWALWPLGGYVQLLNTRIEPVSSPKEHRHCFDKQAVWKRILILLAGAFANILIAWLALLFIKLLGYQQSAPVIATVSSSGLAAQAGLKAGDRFIAIAGQTTASWREVGMGFLMTLGKRDVDVVVADAAGVTRETKLDLGHWQYHRQNNALFAGMGIKPDLSVASEHVPGLSLIPAMQQSFWQLQGLVVFFLVMLKQLVTGAIPFAVLLGPLGMLSAMVSSFTQGMVIFLYFIATLSLAVALINLFPLPGLDGGSIVYTLIEKIRGKPLEVELEVLLHRLAFILFAVFLVQLILNDLQRYLH